MFKKYFQKRKEAHIQAEIAEGFSSAISAYHRDLVPFTEIEACVWDISQPFDQGIQQAIDLLKSAETAFNLYDLVDIYDRYRFTIKVTGQIVKFADSNDGVQVKLTTTHSPRKYPKGSAIWVSSKQLRLLS